MITRRKCIGGAAVALGFGGLAPAGARATEGAAGLPAALARLEAEHGGRLGVAVLDTGSGEQAGHRLEERFALCSTFKVLAAACVLARVDRGEESLSRRVTYGQEDLVTYSPITGKHAGDGMTVGAICEAAVTLSDNTAGNLMLDSFGGPAGLTAYLRSLGDGITRLDRRETALNEALPGDPRDTTTPSAMVGLLQKLVLGTALSPASREQLSAWLIGCKTGDRRLRAGVPKGWRVGDKTGTGERNATNDVAILWPPGRAPVIVAAYYAESRASADTRDAVLAEVGRLAATI
jgi:beta-lactamase class A